MRILALDLSTKPGYAVLDFKDGVPDVVLSGNGKPDCIFVGNSWSPEDYRSLGIARGIQLEVHNLTEKLKPDFFAIEQTNQGKNRTTQKQLEFIHCLVLQLLESKSHRVIYVDSGAWRSKIQLKLSDDQKRHNRIIKLKKQIANGAESAERLAKLSKELAKLEAKGATNLKGKVTWKHLSVARVNEMFPHLKFKLKDNDRADAICLGLAAHEILTKRVGHIDVDKILTQQ